MPLEYLMHICPGLLSRLVTEHLMGFISSNVYVGIGESDKPIGNQHDVLQQMKRRYLPSHLPAISPCLNAVSVYVIYIIIVVVAVVVDIVKHRHTNLLFVVVFVRKSPLSSHPNHLNLPLFKELRYHPFDPPCRLMRGEISLHGQLGTTPPCTALTPLESPTCVHYPVRCSPMTHRYPL